MEHDPSYFEKNRKRMDTVDNLPGDIRALIHEYNYGIVEAFLSCGVSKAKQIRHLIERARGDSASYSNGRFSPCPHCHGTGRRHPNSLSE